MIFDCFCYFNEDDLLEIRLNELYEVVDKFVICEGNKTFTGLDKDYNFDINKYNKFKDKIIYIKANLLSNPIDSWENQINQRNYLIKGIEDIVEDTDYILLSDLDEIVSASSLKMALHQITEDNLLIFFHELYYYYVNYYSTDFYGAKLVKYKKLRTTFHNKMNELRNFWFGNDLVFKTGGWHFSSLGGEQAIKTKLKSISEQKFNNEKKLLLVFERLNNMKDLIGRQMIKREVTINSHPKYLVENINKFKHFIG